MKRNALLLIVMLILILTACKMPASEIGSSATATTGAEVLTPQSEAVATSEPATGESLPVPDQPQPSPTAAQPLAVTATNPPVQPAPTLAPATATPQAPADAPQAAPATPTKTSKPAVRFNPYTTYGDPKYLDEMTGGSFTEWAKPETNSLPDTDYIQLQFKSGKLYVTGKLLDFSTWWFTYHELQDFYLETTFDTQDCSGSDAYGMILRGPEHLAGASYGYIVAFTCDGQYWAFRLDDADPWDVEELIDETPSTYIKNGSDQENVMGIRADGKTITIVANGYEIAEFTDKEYSMGRFGAFVRAGDTINYTYRITKLAYWLLGEDE